MAAGGAHAPGREGVLGRNKVSANGAHIIHVSLAVFVVPLSFVYE